MDPTRDVLDGQRQFWDTNFASRPEMFGDAPSDPAQKAQELIKAEARTRLLELGGGQGRDTLFFARNGIHVTMLDYSEAAVGTVNRKAQSFGMESFVTAMRHDVREPLPFTDNTFEAAFSHMLYCMPITNAEVERLSQEILRVLKPGGLNIFTVRHTGDPHFGAGVYRGEEMYEVGGFIVNFFGRSKVERVSKGYEIVGVDEFEEGGMPRRLFRVTLRKP
jgi:ubiquinone/menaquinone biosynthesis C-methylase UbiE